MSTNTPEINQTIRTDPTAAENGVPLCPLVRSFEVMGTKTAYVIMREALYGSTRFEEFVERTGMSEPVASARLRELTADGLLEKVPYQEPGKRTRHRYRLTEKGSDLLPVMVALMRWSDKWLYPDGARIDLAHSDCGAPVHAVLRCEAGHQLGAGEVDLIARRRDTSP